MLAREHPLDAAHDTGCIHAVLGEQVGVLAGLGERIRDADKLRRRSRAAPGKHLRHGAAEAAVDVVLLGGDDLAALPGSLEDDVLIQRLDGVDVDDAGMDCLLYTLTLPTILRV